MKFFHVIMNKKQEIAGLPSQLLIKSSATITVNPVSSQCETNINSFSSLHNASALASWSSVREEAGSGRNPRWAEKPTAATMAAAMSDFFICGLVGLVCCKYRDCKLFYQIN